MPTPTTRRRLHRRLASGRSIAFRGSIEDLERRFALAVTYHGGSLLTEVAAQGVYVGLSSTTSSSNWTSNATLAGQKTQLDAFLSYIVNSPYMDMLDAAGYNNPGNVASPPSFRGTADPGVVANTLTSTKVSDAQIQSVLQTQINSGAVKAPSASRLYVVYVASGIEVTVDGHSSVNTFLGYHGSFAGRTATGAAAKVRYAVMPYPGAPNPSPVTAGFPSIVDEETAVSSHEIAEAVTDPDPTSVPSWYDEAQGGEIADLTHDMTRLNGYLVTKVVDKNDNVIGPTGTPTPHPVVTSLTINPTSITVGASTAVVLTANATDSTAATITGVKFYTSSGTLLGSGVASGNNWSLTIDGTSSLAVGRYTYYAVATDSAGVRSPSGPSATSVALTVNATAPANDAFANATVVTGTSFSVTGTNVGATKQSGEPNVAGYVGGKSVWWSWTAPSSGKVSLATAGSSFDTLLGVYTGTSVSALTLVASNNDSGRGVTSAVTFNAVAGTTYRFVVDGYAAASGSISLGLTMATTTAPANDAFANATVVTGTSFSVTGTNVGATKQSGEPNVAGYVGGKSVWWSWTAPSSGKVSLTTAGSSFDTLLGVYTGTSVSALTLVASNNDSGRGVTSAVTFNAVAGTTYRFVVDGYAAASGSISLGLTMATTTAPANDAFANATVVTGTSFSVTGTNVGATKQSGEPNVAGYVGGKSVWWSWTAPSSGKVSLTTAGSSFDTLLGVYTGTSVSALTLVASNDDAGGGVVTSAVTFTAVAGTTYRFVVDGYAAASGSISLSLTNAAAAALTGWPRSGEGSSRRDQPAVASSAGFPKSEAFAALAHAASSEARPHVRLSRIR